MLDKGGTTESVNEAALARGMHVGGGDCFTVQEATDHARQDPGIEACIRLFMEHGMFETASY